MKLNELMVELGLLSIKTSLVKVTLKMGQKKYLLSILFWKLIFGLVYKLKDLNGEKIMGVFYEI